MHFEATLLQWCDSVRVTECHLDSSFASKVLVINKLQGFHGVALPDRKFIRTNGQPSVCCTVSQNDGTGVAYCCIDVALEGKMPGG